MNTELLVSLQPPALVLINIGVSLVEEQSVEEWVNIWPPVIIPNAEKEKYKTKHIGKQICWVKVDDEEDDGYSQELRELRVLEVEDHVFKVT